MPFACIFVPDFPAEALVRAEPELRSQALAVLEGKPPLQKVFALNEKARRAGIELGMSKLQVEACIQVLLRSRCPLQEAAAHAALLDCAQSFSPRVEDTAGDTLLLDLAGLESLFGPLPKIARDVARRASDLGIEASVAVAWDPNTAVLAARGFSGVTVIPEGEEADRLGGLPLDVLFAVFSAPAQKNDAERFLETLERWGVRNLRSLAALPEIAISERLGQEGVRLQQMARGRTSRTLVPFDAPLIFEEAVELEHPLVLLEPLAFLLQQMLDQLCTRLSARALAMQELRLQLALDSGCHATEDFIHAQPREEGPKTSAHATLFTRTLRLPVAMLDAKVFLKLLQLDLKAHPPGAPIMKIYLSAEPVQPRHSQNGLFLPASPVPDKLELTLARISRIVGENRVGSLELLDTHRPEAFHIQHFAPSESQVLKDSAFLTSADKTNVRKKRLVAPFSNSQGEPQKPYPEINQQSGTVTALRIFRPPLRATVALRDGMPGHIDCSRRKEVQGEINWLAGPWRSSGDWWEQEGWARDEWDIALPAEGGIALYRLVRDLLSGNWFVEGTYD